MSNEKVTLPMQPIEDDGRGVLRFRRNAIVAYLLDAAGRGERCDMNTIAMLSFPQEDREQFAQLIGYSISGYHELPYVSDESALAASSSARLRVADYVACRDRGCAIHGGPLLQPKRRRSAKKARESTSAATIGNASGIFAALGERYGGAEQESFFVVAMNIRNQMIGGPLEIARGTASSVEVHPRDVFRAAVRVNAVAVVIAHNHPTGDPSPSVEDVALTKRMRAVGELLGIPVLDHVVFTSDSYRSICEHMGSSW